MCLSVCGVWRCVHVNEGRGAEGDKNKHGDCMKGSLRGGLRRAKQCLSRRGL